MRPGEPATRRLPRAGARAPADTASAPRDPAAPAAAGGAQQPAAALLRREPAALSCRDTEPRPGSGPSEDLSSP
jgi:hypothetical protein